MKKEISITMTRRLLPAQITQLVRDANRFDSYILIEANNRQINVKNPLSAMSFFPSIKGLTIVVRATGSDADQALGCLCPYFREEQQDGV
ncbi:HPr family phosphocarrier protein [Brevibacillus humidisoli]|uniref:HPr family phosphocarrier protein n=1 Tax=Brevibacillus humidisoli TaxID=2895522 RepID=UPI001E5C59C2|nr:HPr family phosphocarrier protein [Brevibacillus humidisoli]UFJ42226.1 HPr family phosphocarrier protein [Brevibacillus humidisoli]